MKRIQTAQMIAGHHAYIEHRAAVQRVLAHVEREMLMAQDEHEAAENAQDLLARIASMKQRARASV